MNHYNDFNIKTMEEKKTTQKETARQVNMRPNGQAASQEDRKLTYEQLNDACQQLFQQNQQLRLQLQEANMVNVFKRMDYLFKVLELSHRIKDQEFVASCEEELKEALTIREDADNKTED